MKMNPFSADVGILTAEEVLYVNKQIIKAIHPKLQARKLFPLVPIEDSKVHRHYIETDPNEASITLDGKAQSFDHPELTAGDVTVPVISKESNLNFRDLNISKKSNTNLLERTIETATYQIATVEDRLLISGDYTGWAALNIEGLFGATGRLTGASAGAWPANAIADINAGKDALEAAGFDSKEAVLVAPHAILGNLNALVPNTAVTYNRPILEDLIADIIPSTNAFAQDGGVDSACLVIPGRNNFYAVQGEPIHHRLWEDAVGNVTLTIREMIAPVISQPTSIYEITTIT